jgi:hypothetical protein
LITAAWRLLARLEPYKCPPLDRLWIEPLDDETSGLCTSAGEIIISPSSRLYRSGDVLAIAMLLHHEFFHAVHGPDERAAYQASAAFATRHAPYLLPAVHESWQQTVRNRFLDDLIDNVLEEIDRDDSAW